MITLLELARRALSAAALSELVSEVTKSIPEVTGQYRFLGEWRTVRGMAATKVISGRSYHFPVVKQLPTVAFRHANEGVTMGDGAIQNKLVETYILNPNWYADVAVADQDVSGMGSLMAEQAALNLQAAFQKLATQFYYGTGADGKGHPGISAAVGYSVDATGTTSNGKSSVYAVKWGPAGVRWVMGENGRMRVEPISKRPVTDANGKTFTAYFQELFCYAGLHVGSVKAIGRIYNLTAQSGKGLTDALFADLLAQCDQAFWPDCFLVPNRCVWQLQKSRTATNATGAEAPLPTDYMGIPIIVSDSLSNTEA